MKEVEHDAAICGNFQQLNSPRQRVSQLEKLVVSIII